MTQVFQNGLANQGKTVFPASRKVYRGGSRPDLQVPFREVSLTPTEGRLGREENPPILLYDTSGYYTDPGVEIDVRQGLPPLRRSWILEREDVEEYPGRRAPGSNGKKTQDFPGLTRRPLRAKAGQPGGRVRLLHIFTAGAGDLGTHPSSFLGRIRAGIGVPLQDSRCSFSRFAR